MDAVTMTAANIDLFGAKLPSYAEVQQFAEWVNSDQENQREFSGTIEENSSKALPAGVGLFILGKYADSIEKLGSAPDSADKFLYLAVAQLRLRDYDAALTNIDKASKAGLGKVEAGIVKAEILVKKGDLDEAGKLLGSIEADADENPDFFFIQGRLNEAVGEYEEAIESYNRALDIDPEHKKALFHLAYRYDLSGEEQAALDYYKQLASLNPMYISGLINLAIIYEDHGQFEKAAKYIGKILKAHPTHARARMFLRDIENSKTMFFDEEKEKKKSRKNQMLETPISDFELSVRSRNCLKKMNINTIGDLLNITESELLSYKNFGETSLKEIKAILASKGMHLGMSLEESQLTSEPARDSAAEEANEEIYSKSVDELGLSVRARKCLQKLGMRTIGDLTSRTDAELLGCKNFGVTSLNEIRKALAGLGLSLRSLD